ncbi:MAG: hypothetical protein IPL84_15260 [Chitinophagaceae bacterium]|nr:hypothetical protein [Chitinophagaceae bacterium]
MKKQTNSSFAAAMPDELKKSREITAISKKPGYIYTEEDLGEGILDIGISC